MRFGLLTQDSGNNGGFLGFQRRSRLLERRGEGALPTKTENVLCRDIAQIRIGQPVVSRTNYLGAAQ